ncbi:DUF58 domain-containing protein [Jatrophihabitans sp. YIM 134969]
MTTPGPRSRWRVTTAFTSAAGIGTVLLVLAGVTHRPALVLLATPLLAEVAWAVRRVVRPPVAVDIRPTVGRAREGDVLELDLAVEADADADLVLTETGTEPLLEVPAERFPVAQTPAAATRRVTAHAAHWGVGQAGRTYAVAFAGHGLLRSAPVIAMGEEMVVEPVPESTVPIVPTRRTGVTGPRVSRRPGVGSELTGVRPFVAGDRLRQVHWRVTARRGDLHVTTTAADREASILLAVDSSSELGPLDATTLDVAVRAAAGLARRHLRDGDRVGVVDLGDPTRVLRPAAGGRQLQRVVDRLVRMRHTVPVDLGRLPAVVERAAPGAMVVVLSPVLRPAVGAAVARLAQAGVATTVVDTLGEVDRGALLAARRLLLLDRDATVNRLVDVGVAVRPWR